MTAIIGAQIKKQCGSQNHLHPPWMDIHPLCVTMRHGAAGSQDAKCEKNNQAISAINALYYGHQIFRAAPASEFWTSMNGIPSGDCIAIKHPGKKKSTPAAHAFPMKTRLFVTFIEFFLIFMQDPGTIRLALGMNDASLKVKRTRYYYSIL